MSNEARTQITPLMEQYTQSGMITQVSVSKQKFSLTNRHMPTLMFSEKTIMYARNIWD